MIGAGGETGSAKHYLDITQEVCPLTFVRTKLLLERMGAGEIAEVRLTAGEPLDNVPRSVREEGHEILSLEPEGETAPGGGGGGIYRLVIRKC